jgi:hypothetical protein
MPVNCVWNWPDSWLCWCPIIRKTDPLLCWLDSHSFGSKFATLLSSASMVGKCTRPVISELQHSQWFLLWKTLNKYCYAQIQITLKMLLRFFSMSKYFSMIFIKTIKRLSKCNKLNQITFGIIWSGLIYASRKISTPTCWRATSGWAWGAPATRREQGDPRTWN